MSQATPVNPDPASLRTALPVDPDNPIPPEVDADRPADRSAGLGANPGEPSDGCPPSDDLDKLLPRVRADDPAAMARLHEAVTPLATAIARRYRQFLPRGVEVEDLLQEMALRLGDAVRGYNAERTGDFLSYLSLDLRRHVLSFLRAEARRSGHNAAQRERLIRLARDAVVDPFASVPDLVSPRVRAALRQLTPRQRTVITGIYWRERQTLEVAAELGVTEQAITAARRRAEARLRELLRSRPR